MADHILGDSPTPPDLIRALDYRAWGVDLFQLPPGEKQRMNTVMNAYNALTGYKRAGGNTKGWAAANPDAWETASALLGEWMKRQREADNV